jgi:uroporphyrin-III C-methyltransferase / precorrin-2 dehydrogenase / sirohydrochlorin ferrochelatase
MRVLPASLRTPTRNTPGKAIALVGSGPAALGKLRTLRAGGARVRWFPLRADVAEEALTLAGPGRLEISIGDPLKADLSDVAAIVAAVGNDIDAAIVERARVQRIPVNVVDHPELSSVVFPDLDARLAREAA